jgi:putative phosphoesterase
MRCISSVGRCVAFVKTPALAALEGSDLILHAGDVGDPDILDALKEIAPTYAVFGNTDYGALRAALPHSQVVDLMAADPAAADQQNADTNPVLAYVLHIQEELGMDPKAAGMRVVVFGHTREPLIQERDGVLWMNPGSAGPRRFSLPVTVGRVRISHSEGEAALEAEILDLATG